MRYSVDVTAFEDPIENPSSGKRIYRKFNEVDRQRLIQLWSEGAYDSVAEAHREFGEYSYDGVRDTLLRAGFSVSKSRIKSKG